MLLFLLVRPPRQSRKNKGICNKFAELQKLRSDRCRCLLILYDCDRCFVFRLQGSDRSLQGIHAVGVLPLHAQILAAHVAVCGQLAVDGLAQVEFADDGGGGQVKDLSTACSIFSSETVPVPKVSTMMDTGFATPMA